MKNNLCLLIIFCFCSTLLFSQKGNDVDYGNSSFLSQREINEYFKNRRQKTTATADIVPVRVHLIKGPNGQLADSNLISKHLININERFDTINLKFEICGGFNVIDQPDYYVLNSSEEQYELVSSNNDPETIDIFYVGGETYRGYCGLATLGWNSDGYIIMVCNTESTLIHELGHYFNLPHTHSDLFGKELVDGSNCEIAGDQICDTPADPNLSGKVNFNCEYTGIEKDANGMSYSPLLNNIMSYSMSNCRDEFTENQNQRMRYYYETHTNLFQPCSNLPDLEYATIYKPLVFLPQSVENVSFKIKNPSFIDFDSQVKINIAIKLRDGTLQAIETKIIDLTLNKFEEEEVSIPVSLPSSLTNGLYDLVITLDPENTIAEKKENNNSGTIKATVQTTATSLPDLVAFIDGANIHESGTIYTALFQATNFGSDTTEVTSQTVYLSEDSLLDNSDIVIASYSLGKLPPLKTSSFQVRTTVPKTLNKPFYLHYVVDTRGKIDELNESNNLYTLRVKNIPPKEDIEKPDLYISSHSFAWGDSITLRPLANPYLKFKVEQTGGSPFEQITNSLTGIYLSKDTIPSSDDLLIFESLNERAQFRVPLNIFDGSGYILIVADYKDYVYESNENNNVYYLPINFENTPKPDIGIFDASLTSYTWEFNDQVDLDMVIKNYGRADSKDWYYTLFLEKEKFLYASNLFYAELSSFRHTSYIRNILAPNETADHTYQINVDETKFEVGVYYMAVCASTGSFDDWKPNNCMVLEEPIIINEETITAIGSKEEQLVSLYPNPSKGQINIVSHSEAEIEIIDMSGQIVRKKQRIEAGKTSLNGLKDGIYILTIYSNNSLQREKIIVNGN